MPFRLPLSSADALGLLSTVLALWFSLPQLLRLARTRSTAGVSPGGLANSVVSLTAWTLYGAAHGYVWVVAGSVVGIPATVATLVVARRVGARAGLLVPAIWAGILLAAAVLSVLVVPGVLDVAIGCSILWLVVPAAVHAWRSADVFGIAPQAWLVLAVEASVFGLYGWVSGVGADRVYGVVALAGSAAVLARLAVARAGRARPEVADVLGLPQVSELPDRTTAEPDQIAA
jgi:uncharacterized protein with PQ loop repeat